MTFQVFNALKLDKIAKSVSSLMIACFQVKEQIVYLLLKPSFCHWHQRYYCHCQTFLPSKSTVSLSKISLFHCLLLHCRASNSSMSRPTTLWHRLVSVLLSYMDVLIPVTVNTYVLSLSLPTPMFLSLPTTVHTHAFVTVNIYFCHWQ